MQLTVNANQLLTALATCAPAVANNPVIPILENFLLEVNDSRLTVKASNMQVTVTRTIALPAEDVQEGGAICLPAKLLLDLVKSLPGTTYITLSTDEKHTGTVSDRAGGKWKLAGENPIDWPRLNHADLQPVGSINSNVISDAVHALGACVSRDDLRPSMCGYHVLSKDGLQLTTTDGHRAARLTVPCDVSDFPELIIPGAGMTALAKAFSGDELHVSKSASHVRFESNTTSVSVRLIDERYPNVDGTLASLSLTRSIEVHLPTLIAYIKRALSFTNKTTNQIGFLVGWNLIAVVAENIDFGNQSIDLLQDVSKFRYTGDQFQFFVNGKLFLEVLNGVRSEWAVLYVEAANRPIYIEELESDADSTLIAVVMPVMADTNLAAIVNPVPAPAEKPKRSKAKVEPISPEHAAAVAEADDVFGTE